MALVYTGSTGIFTHLGVFIGRINGYQALGLTTIPADLQTVLTALGSAPAGWLPEEGVASFFDGMRDSVTSWRQGLASFCDRRLLDVATVLAPLRLSPGAGLDEVLPGLHRDMLLTGNNVTACTCTAGTPTVPTTPANQGDGRVYVTDKLDGYNAPLLGGPSSIYFDGLTTQLCCPSEVMTLECVADSVQDGTAEGGELWRWDGGPAYGELDVRQEGSGPGPGLVTCDEGDNLLTNGGLETWSGTTSPSGWTATGTVARSATAFRGSYSAQFTGDGSLVQAVRPTRVQGRRRYWVGLAFSSTVTAGQLRAYFTGTNYIATEELSLAGAAWPSGFARYGFFVTAPHPVPSDWALRVEVTGSGGATWLVDSLAMTPVAYHGGVGAVVSAGASRWQKGDRVTFTTANDELGKFQNFFRRWWRWQLPSVASSPYSFGALTLPFLLIPWPTTESIPDSLAS